MPRNGGATGGSGRKHHIKKETMSRYRARLTARGLSRAPEMPSLDSIRHATAGLTRALVEARAAREAESRAGQPKRRRKPARPQAGQGRQGRAAA